MLRTALLVLTSGTVLVWAVSLSSKESMWFVNLVCGLPLDTTPDQWKAHYRHLITYLPMSVSGMVKNWAVCRPQVSPGLNVSTANDGVSGTVTHHTHLASPCHPLTYLLARQSCSLNIYSCSLNT